MPTITTDSVTIYYDIRGAGSAVILFNHSGVSGLAWSERFLELLAEHLTVVTIDYRGTGLSSPAAGGFSLADLAADGYRVLQAEGIDKMIVIGTSMGGAVAQEFVLKYADQVAALVLLGTFAGQSHSVPADAAVLELLKPPPVPETRIEKWRRLLPTVYSAKFLERHEDLALELELKGSRFMTDETVARHGAAVAGFDSYQRLPTIVTPALIIHGTADPIFPVKNGEILAERISGSEFVAMEGLGHLPAVEAPLEVAGLILDFLTRRGVKV